MMYVFAHVSMHMYICVFKIGPSISSTLLLCAWFADESLHDLREGKRRNAVSYFGLFSTRSPDAHVPPHAISLLTFSCAFSLHGQALQHSFAGRKEKNVKCLCAKPL